MDVVNVQLSLILCYAKQATPKSCSIVEFWNMLSRYCAEGIKRLLLYKVKFHLLLPSNISFHKTDLRKTYIPIELNPNEDKVSE